MATIRVTLSQTYFNQVFQNVLHFNKPDFVASDLDALITDVQNSWINQVRWIQADGLKYINMKMHNVGAGTVDRNQVLSTLGAAGGSSEFKTFYAHIIRIQSPVGGRTGRGRVYIGGMAFNLADFGIIKAAILATWNTKLSAIMDAFGPTGTSSFRLGVNPHSEVDDFKGAVSLSINPVEGIQRRRNIGIGI